MKTSSISIPLIVAAAASALTGLLHAQPSEFQPEGKPAARQDTVKYTLLKPGDKTSEMVKPDEHNPFARSEVEAQNQSEKGTGEENAIRERLEKLRVVGVSPGSRGLRVMLGNMVLEAGQLVPQLLPEQSVGLRVGNISSEAIELFWLEAKPSGLPPRKLTIAVDLRPYVRYQLLGQPTQKNQFEKGTDDAAKVPVARLFPEVSQASAAGSAPVAVAAPTTVPPAPVQPAPVPTAPVPTRQAAVVPPTVPATAPKPPVTTKPDMQWQKAMALLEEIERKEEKKP